MSRVWAGELSRQRGRCRRMELALKVLLAATKPLVTSETHPHGCRCDNPVCRRRRDAEAISRAILEEEE